ncbi:MAG TPA: Wzz/FepE/Etk N-terminal domain-containing protein [Phototrophicaceae bacterium]|nr:Wzz/FepE/Etk N-terminal domain-containing protein [Phototrophicaceae bacterium]
MNLIDYGRILLRRGWIMLLLAVMAAGGAYFLSKQQAEVYQSSQQVLIQPARTDLGVAEAIIRVLYSYAVYIDSEQVAQKVIDQLQLDMTPGYLKGNVFVAPDTLRLTIQIDARLPGDDCQLANDVARVWGEQLVMWRNQQNQLQRKEDRVDAMLPDAPSCTLYAPLPTVNAAVGGALGLLLGGIIVFVLEYLESSVIRRREDLERVLEIPVLAAIPENEG